jgi:uncharacterized protein (DUF1778 family)
MRQPRAEEGSKNVTIRLSPEERKKLKRAAESNRQDLSGFARDAILNAADDALGDDDSDKDESIPPCD